MPELYMHRLMCPSPTITIQLINRLECGTGHDIGNLSRINHSGKCLLTTKSVWGSGDEK